MINKRVLEKVEGWLIHNGAWKLSPEMRHVYRSEIETYDDTQLTYNVAINDINDVKGFFKKYFPRHFLKIQHTLHDISLKGEDLLSRGFRTITILDIGCGPGTASLAALDYYFQVISGFVLTDLNIAWPYKVPIEFRFLLVDKNNDCLSQASKLIKNYLEYISSKYGGIEKFFSVKPKIITICEEYPDAISEINKAIIDFENPPKLIFYSNVLVPLLNRWKCDDGSWGYCDFCKDYKTRNCESAKKVIASHESISNNLREEYYQVIIIQEKNNWEFIDSILPESELYSEVCKMKQKNYDDIYTSKYFTSKYGRAIFHHNS
ncbi:hypothetical protein [Heliophilum fasciatum]|uniref:Methyltransferase family protein n=1 Tax=Heliophilum fasciatum TaxID=35700 RepID=A0A4R2RJ50_9FIRM|nr:hypothetical protein [Heliophilum fasciatum]MCW2278722.1 SAM-dependent methyltransferase [Heliophilum fasciatum]TCP62539.1 hypothetical protein EDD73_12137 [Heliophilum fasciatum]